MAEVSLLINGRSYDISCDDGQEKRVRELGKHVDSCIKQISAAGAATNENHLLVLASLVMADELFTLRDQAQGSSGFEEDEAAIAGAIDTLAERIDSIADRIQSA